MFTVLERMKSSGDETLYEVDRVEYHEVDSAECGAGLTLHWNDGSGVHLGKVATSDESRDVFVMNRDGKTVARYAL